MNIEPCSDRHAKTSPFRIIIIAYRETKVMTFDARVGFR